MVCYLWNDFLGQKVICPVFVIFLRGPWPIFIVTEAFSSTNVCLYIAYKALFPGCNKMSVLSEGFSLIWYEGSKFGVKIRFFFF